MPLETASRKDSKAPQPMHTKGSPTRTLLQNSVVTMQLYIIKVSNSTLIANLECLGQDKNECYFFPSNKRKYLC